MRQAYAYKKGDLKAKDLNPKYVDENKKRGLNCPLFLLYHFLNCISDIFYIGLTN